MAFANNPNLSFVEIAASVVEIDKTAFESCTPEMIIIASPESAAVPMLSGMLYAVSPISGY